ncbi:MAG: homoserine dehydrogenase [Chloroflexi bacterium]|nr:homoserine dehydrogenase [Chloroflexota bacterium]
MKQEVNVGLLGLGVVGSAVARTLIEKSEMISTRVGCPVRLRRVLVRQQGKERSIPASLITFDPAAILEDPEIDVVIELMGGEIPAHDYLLRALRQGKQVVTANKEVMAKHGPEIMAAAAETGTDVAFEASVGGGIPVVGPFRLNLLANNLQQIIAIINGTTNYILSRMAHEGIDFQAALAEAQKLGYAEPNPRNDVEGIDAAYKLAILATLGFHTRVRPEDVFHEGIARLTARDFRYARELGYTIKLLAIAKQHNSEIEARVHPTFVPEGFTLASVDGVYNAVHVIGDLAGPVMFYGRGAGPGPTSSAVVADVIDLAQRLHTGMVMRPVPPLDSRKRVKPVEEIETRYYLRIQVTNQPGVFAQIARVMGEAGISLASVIQKEERDAGRQAEVVLTTYLAREAAMRQALQALLELPVVDEISNVVRVED